VNEKLEWRKKQMSMLASMNSRFEWHGNGAVWSGGADWWLRDHKRHPRIDVSSLHCSDEDFWAFFGPLADQGDGLSIVCRKCAGTMWINKPFAKGEQFQCDECGGTGRYDNLLDACIAHAVLIHTLKAVAGVPE